MRIQHLIGCVFGITLCLALATQAVALEILVVNDGEGAQFMDDACVTQNIQDFFESDGDNVTVSDVIPPFGNSFTTCSVGLAELADLFRSTENQVRAGAPGGVINIFVSDVEAGTISRQIVDGSAATTVVSGVENLGPFAISSEFKLLVYAAGQDIWQSNIDGSDVKMLLRGIGSPILHLAILPDTGLGITYNLFGGVVTKEGCTNPDTRETAQKRQDFLGGCPVSQSGNFELKINASVVGDDAVQLDLLNALLTACKWKNKSTGQTMLIENPTLDTCSTPGFPTNPADKLQATFVGTTGANGGTTPPPNSDSPPVVGGEEEVFLATLPQGTCTAVVVPDENFVTVDCRFGALPSEIQNAAITQGQNGPVICSLDPPPPLTLTGAAQWGVSCLLSLVPFLQQGEAYARIDLQDATVMGGLFELLPGAVAPNVAGERVKAR